MDWGKGRYKIILIGVRRCKQVKVTPTGFHHWLMFVSSLPLITRVCVELGGAMVTFSTLVQPFPQIHVLLLHMKYPSYSPAILGPLSPIPIHIHIHILNPHPQLLSPLPSSSQASPTQVSSLDSLDSKFSQSNKEPVTTFVFVPYHNPETRDIFPSSTHRQ